MLTLAPFLALSDDGDATSYLYAVGANTLTEKFDVFSEHNKEYTLKLGELNGHQSLSFLKKEKSNNINVSSSWVLVKNGRYSQSGSGKIEIKFEGDPTLYDLGGASNYLSAVTCIDKELNTDLFAKMATKKIMHVKINVVGQEYVFKVDLKGVDKMLHDGAFIDLDTDERGDA